MRERGVGRAVGREDRLAGEQLVHDRAERIDVTPRIGRAAANLLGGDRLRRAEHGEYARVAVRRGRTPAQTIGPEVDERDRRIAPPRGAADKHVFELEIAVDEVRLVEGRERLEDATKHPLQLVDVGRARTGEARRERLRVDVIVRHVVQPSVELARLDVARQAGMLGGRDEAVRREKALHGPLVTDRFAAEELDDPLFGAALGEVDDRQLALTQLAHDDERTDDRPRAELVAPQQRGDVADARVDPLARDEDDVDQRFDAIAIDAPLGQGVREARFRVGAADIGRVQAEQLVAHRRQLFERKEALELTAEYLDRGVHRSLPRGAARAPPVPCCYVLLGVARRTAGL